MINYKVKKGDTLNKIAQAHGFSNYKDAGITSVASGNFDLITPDEEITLNNYNPKEISTIGSTDPVVSSLDLSQSYKEGSDRIDTEENQQKEASKIVAPPVVDTTGKKTNEARKETEATGNTATDNYNKYIMSKQLEADQAVLDAEASREQRSQLFKTSLANIDATTQSTLNSINTTYDKRLAEQKRINQLNIDRTKAYGLSGGGIYTPMMFSDAISNREEEADAKVGALENERNNLISQAKSARDLGEVGLMNEKLDALDKVNETLKKTLNEIDKEVAEQYKTFKAYNKELEAEHLTKVENSRKVLSAMAQNLTEEYEKDPETFIQEILNNPNYTLSYADIIEIMNNAVYSQKETTAKEEKTKLDTKKTEAEIKATNALAEDRKASAFKSYADAGLKDKERQEAIKKEEDMNKDVPEEFADDAEYTKARTSFVKKYGVEGGKYWDSIYPVDKSTGDPVYPKKGGGTGEDPLGIL
jgi:LysM repeat protein